MVEVEGRYCGHITLRNEGSRRAEIAYGSHPWVRGSGHMEHALRMLLDWGFREKDLATVIWLANVGNWASRRVAWRLGFSFEGTLRQWLPHRGELRDAWAGTLLADDPPRAAAALDRRRRPRGERRAAARLPRGGRRTGRRGVPRRPDPGLAGRPAIAVRRGGRPVVHPGSHRRPGPGDGLSWAVADLASDEVLGSVGLFDLTDDLAYGEVGYWTHPAARGRGVMTAAVGLVLTHAFETLGLQRVKAYAARDNAASRRVLEGQRPHRARRRAPRHRAGRRPRRRSALRRPA